MTTISKRNPSPPGPGHTCRQNNGDPVLVPHPPGPRNQRQHPEPELSLEAGGCGAAAAPWGASRRLGPSGCEAPQEHHLHLSPHREPPKANGAMISNTIVLTSASFLLFNIYSPCCCRKVEESFYFGKTFRSYTENQCCDHRCRL